VAFSSMRTPLGLCRRVWISDAAHRYRQGQYRRDFVRMFDGNRAAARRPCAHRIRLDSLEAGDHVEILNPISAEACWPVVGVAAAAIVYGLAAIGLMIWRNLPRFGRSLRRRVMRRSLASRFAQSTVCLAYSTPRIPAPGRVPGAYESAFRRLAFYERMDAAQRIGALAARTARLRRSAGCAGRKSRWRAESHGGIVLLEKADDN